jgi:thiol:disulfide interchange protein DsbD
VFSSDAVESILTKYNVLVVTADNTDGDAIIKRDMDRADRKSLPTNLIYPADPSRPAIMLPEYLTPDIVIKAIESAAGQ